MTNIKHNELIILSKDSYLPIDDTQSNKGYKAALAAGWEYVGSSDDFGLSKEGYFGVAFKKGNDIVIAHRGTNFLDSKFSSDIDDDIALHIRKTPDQLKYAEDFTINIMAKHKDGAYSYTTTGHSLAAGHSQITGIKFNIPSVVFDSPGMLNVAKQLFTEEKILNYAKDSLTIYNSAPNAINAGTGPHITNPIHVKVTSAYHHPDAFGY